MKQCLLLALIFYLAYCDQKLEPTSTPPPTLGVQQAREKALLLHQLVAEHWGYVAPFHLPTDDRDETEREAWLYLQQVSDLLLRNYHLDKHQKVNSILARHILKCFEKSISQAEYIQQIHEIDALGYSTQELSFIGQEGHLFLESLLDSMVFSEDEVEINLLIESFAPEDVVPLREYYGDKYEYIKDLADMALSKPALNVGTFYLINKLLDAEYRDTIKVRQVLQLSSRELQSYFQKRVLANFNVPKNKTGTTETTTASPE